MTSLRDQAPQGAGARRTDHGAAARRSGVRASSCGARCTRPPDFIEQYRQFGNRVSDGLGCLSEKPCKPHRKNQNPEEDFTETNGEKNGRKKRNLTADHEFVITRDSTRRVNGCGTHGEREQLDAVAPALPGSRCPPCPVRSAPRVNFSLRTALAAWPRKYGASGHSARSLHGTAGCGHCRFPMRKAAITALGGPQLALETISHDHFGGARRHNHDHDTGGSHGTPSELECKAFAEAHKGCSRAGPGTFAQWLVLRNPDPNIPPPLAGGGGEGVEIFHSHCSTPIPVPARGRNGYQA